MPLPSSGPLSISAIRNELVGTYGSSYSLRQLSSWAGFGTPDSISEFYGYSAVTNLYIDWFVPSSMICWGGGIFGAYVNPFNNVNTDVSVTINWSGDLGGFISTTVTIPINSSCNSTFVSGVGSSCIGENTSFTTATISPSASGNQIFNPGSQSGYGFTPC